MNIFLLTFIISVSLFHPSCSREKNENSNTSSIRTPVQTGDGWPTGKLTGAGVDSIKLKFMVDRICDRTYQNIHSVLLIKEGKLVFEHYFPGHKFNYQAPDFQGSFTHFTANSIHNLASVTKSITSILFGIALDQGYIYGVEEKMFKFFPQYASLKDSMKSQITLEHLLTMTSGLKWNEHDLSYSELKNDIIQLFLVPDPVKYILSKPVIQQPGRHFNYNGGNTNLLGEVIQETTGLKMDAFAKKYLFDPLGIDRCKWIHINSDIIYASGDLKLRPRDMAKIGCLMLNKGTWQSKQVVSSRWADKSTAPYVRFSADAGYGYQWWTKRYKLGNASMSSFSAMGWGGQNIIVLPELDAVVVLTAGNYAMQSPNDEIIYRYILPSLDVNFKFDYEKIKNEAPISEPFEIIQPSNSVHRSIARLSGHWYGRGDFIIADQLVVEKIDAAEASVLYSWGDHPQGYFEKGWVRRTAKVDSVGRIEFPLDSAALGFELDEDEDVLIGSYVKGNARSKLIMNRLEQ